MTIYDETEWDEQEDTTFTVEDMLRTKEEGIVTFLKEIYNIDRASALQLLQKTLNSMY